MTTCRRQYIEDLKRRKGPDADQPHRVQYRKLVGRRTGDGAATTAAPSRLPRVLLAHSQLTVGSNTWLWWLPWMPPTPVPPPATQISPSTNADP